MTAEFLWALFTETGLPDYYILFAGLRAEEEAAVDQEGKTA